MAFIFLLCRKYHHIVKCHPHPGNLLIEPRSALDNGQSLEPEPPAMITALIILISPFFCNP